MTLTKPAKIGLVVGAGVAVGVIGFLVYRATATAAELPADDGTGQIPADPGPRYGDRILVATASPVRIDTGVRLRLRGDV